MILVLSKRLDEFLNTQHHVKAPRRRSYRVAVSAFERVSKRAFEETYLDEAVVNFVLNQLSSKIEDSTWNNYLGIYKKFAKWLRFEEVKKEKQGKLSDLDEPVVPRVWREVKKKKIDWDEKLKNKWLSEEEFYSLLDVVDYPMVKAMFSVVVSGALRSCELLGLRVGDVEFLGGGELRVYISGKTGSRSFVMNQFAPNLRHWLNFHPLKHDENAPLWVRRREIKGTLHEGIKYRQANNIFKLYARRAGIKKPVSLHWLKHTKVTWAAKNRKVRITNKQANATFGWSPNSNMFNRYTHLHGTDTDDTYRALEGVEVVDARKIEAAKTLERRRCFSCNEYNTAEALYCFKCGCVLDEEESKRLADEKAIQKEMMDMWREYMQSKRKVET